MQNLTQQTAMNFLLYLVYVFKSRFYNLASNTVTIFRKLINSLQPATKMPIKLKEELPAEWTRNKKYPSTALEQVQK